MTGTDAVASRSAAPAVPSVGHAKLLVIGGAMLWGTTGTARALADIEAGPAAVGAIRLLVGAAALMVVARSRGWLPRGAISTWPKAAVLGAGVAQAVYGPAFFAGVERAGVAIGTVVGIGSAPVIGGLLGWLVRGERPSRRWAVATGVALAGMAILARGAGGEAVDIVGLAMAVTAGAAYAAFVTASKSLLDHHHPAAVMAVTFSVAAVLLLPALVLGSASLWSVRGAGLTLHLGLVTVGVAYLLFGKGLSGLGVATTSTLTLAEPATAATLGIVILDERVTGTALAGILLIAVGLATLAVRVDEGADRPPPPQGTPFLRSRNITGS